MTFGGWFILIISVGGFLILFIACIYKVLSLSGASKRIEGFEKMTPIDNGTEPLEPSYATRKNKQTRTSRTSA